MPAIALFEPDIPQNTGTLLRLGACLDVPIHIIEPAGFRLDDKALRRAGLDYWEHATMIRHTDWYAFEAWRRQEKRRLILATTRAERIYTDITYQTNDIILAGRESAGVPDDIHQSVDERVIIPMREHQRSINVAIAIAMMTGEILRQTDSWPARSA